MCCHHWRPRKFNIFHVHLLASSGGNTVCSDVILFVKNKFYNELIKSKATAISAEGAI
jgi:hypothetical protein